MPTYKANEPKQAAIYFVEPGTYEVEIVKAVEKTSQAGNPTIKLDVAVLLEGGTTGPTMWEHLTFTAKAGWKVDQVLSSIGRAVIPGEDVSVEAEDLIGEKGVCLLGVEAGQTNPEHQFNCIERWLFGDEKAKWLGNRLAEMIHRAAKTDKHIVAKSNGFVAQPADETDDIPF